MTLEDSARSVFAVLPPPIQGRVLRRMGRVPDWADGTPPEPPACPEGMTTGPPDFVGIGFSKAGTTWWFSLILAHPDVHGPLRKELLYFSRRYFEQRRHGGSTDADLEAYLRWFPRPPDTITGEWTPSYVFRYQLPPLLHQIAPDAGILALVRDPVERYQSDISRRMPYQRLRNVRYRSLANSFYAARLAPWEEAFGASRVLLLQYETCISRPAEQLAATYRFLGLDDSFRPGGMELPVNTTKSKRPLDPGFKRMLADLLEQDVVALAERHPTIDLSLWPNFAHLVGAP